MKSRFWKTQIALLALLVSLASASMAIAAKSPADTVKRTKLRVGTFDSRAVAIAFYASEVVAQEARQWNEEKEKAKAQHDEKAIKLIEAKEISQWKLARYQGLGTAPIDDILMHITAKLPEIAKQAKVDVIISKWSITYRATDAELIDITDLMIAPFKPSAHTKKIMREAIEKPPLSRKAIDQERHDH